MGDNRFIAVASKSARNADMPFSERMIVTIAALLNGGIQMVQMLTYRSDLYRSRQQLRDLSEEMLRDVGLTRVQAENEAKRPFFE